MHRRTVLLNTVRYERLAEVLWVGSSPVSVVEAAPANEVAVNAPGVDVPAEFPMIVASAVPSSPLSMMMSASAQ